MSDSTLDRDYQKRFANPATEHKSFEKWVFHTGLYSSKDGEDVFLKTCGVSKNFLMLGTVVGFLNVKGQQMDMKYLNVRRVNNRRFLAGLIPTVIYGAAFTVFTQGFAKLRGKDGATNHFLGGLATAPLLSLFWAAPLHSAIIWCVALSTPGAYYKSCVVRGVDFTFNDKYSWGRWKNMADRLQDRADGKYN